MIYQKNKNSFQMYENDYIFKTQFIKYLLDIINYLAQLFNNADINTKTNKEIKDNSI